MASGNHSKNHLFIESRVTKRFFVFLVTLLKKRYEQKETGRA